METLIIKPKDKAELNFFVELAKRLGTKATTVVEDPDERLFLAMEKNKKTPRESKDKVMNTLHQIINE